MSWPRSSGTQEQVGRCLLNYIRVASKGNSNSHFAPRHSKERTMADWQLDPFHTQVEFAAKHLRMMTVRGHFSDVTSVADIDPDHPEKMRVEVTIQAASIKTHNEIRDNDIRSEKFLDASAFPVITFTSTEVEPS